MQRTAVLRPTVLAMSLAALFGSASAARAGGIVPTGQTATQLQVNGDVTNITTGTIKGGAGVNAFSHFDVHRGQTANLVVPDAAKALLNLVYDAPVNINGTVNALKNGRVGGNVIFADPHGMLVGAHGVLNVGSLTVLTPTKRFMDGVIDVAGNVSEVAVSQLLSGQVERAPDSVIHIDGVVNALEKISLQAAKVNVSGKLKAGPDVLHQAAFYGSVNTSDISQAAGMVVSNGEIEIVGDESAVVSGTLDVSRRMAAVNTVDAAPDSSASVAGAEKRGKISVMGGAVQLTKTARLDASGQLGGGSIQVGMATGASGAVVHALDTKVEAGASIAADAIERGDGGDIRIWGDASNQMHGDVSARGGAYAGDGGFVEVSAKQGLRVTGKVNTSAQAGRAGMLLIDPDDLQIVEGDAGSQTANSITVGYLQSLGDTNITLAADKSLTVGDSATGGAADVDLTQSLLTSSNSLTLSAASILMNQGSQIRTGGGSVVMKGTTIEVGAGAAIDTVTAAQAAGRGAGDITLAASQTRSVASDVVAWVTADASVDVYGSLKGNNVNLTADANASNSNADRTLTGIFNNVTTMNLADNDSNLKFSTVIPVSLIFNGAGAGVAVASANASVTVHDGASIAALGDVNLASHAAQTSSIKMTLGGKNQNGTEDLSFAAALIYSSLGGGATATIASGAAVDVGRNLSVKAVNDSKLSAVVKTVSATGNAGFTAVIGTTDLNVAASIDKGAVINLAPGGTVDVVARNNGSYAVSATADTSGSPDARAGVAFALSNLVANVSANLGADIGVAGKQAGNVRVQAENLVSANSVSASTGVSKDTTKIDSPVQPALSGMNNTSLASFLSGATAAAGAPADLNAGFKLGAAVAIGNNELGARAGIGAGANIQSSGDVAVVAHLVDAGIGNSATSTVASANAAGAHPSTDASISAALAVGQYAHTASATIGADAGVQAAHIAVDSAIEVPFSFPLQDEVDQFSWNKLSSYGAVLGAVQGLFATPTSVFTSYAGASGAAVKGALAGALSYFSVANDSTAWVGQNARLTTIGTTDAFKVNLQTDAVDKNGAPVLGLERSYANAVSVMASSDAQAITDTGNINSKGGNVSVGGAGNLVIYANKTLAGVDDGVRIATATGTGVNVRADSTDRSIAIAPSSGAGADYGVNGTLALTQYDNQTRAIVSKLATINAASLTVNAAEHLLVVGIAGALVSSESVAVGAGVAINSISGKTAAGIGDVAALRPDGMTSGVGAAGGDGVTADAVTVRGETSGQIIAVSAAGTKSSASDTESEPDPVKQGKAPSQFDSLFATAVTAANIVGGPLKSSLNAAKDVKGVYDKVSGLFEKKDAPPAADKKITADFGLTVSGSVAMNTSALATSGTIDGAVVNTRRLDVTAGNDTDIVAASGSSARVLAGAKDEGNAHSSGAIAGAVALSIEGNSTTAGIDHSTVNGANHVAIQALNTGQHYSLAAGYGSNTKEAKAANVAGSVSLASIENSASAYLRNSTVHGDALAANNDVTVLALDGVTSFVGGGAMVRGGSAGAGVSVSYASSASTVLAEVDNSMVDSINSMSVLALDPTRLITAAAQVASNGSESGMAGGGSFVYNGIDNVVTARIGGGSSIAASGAVKVVATDDAAAEGLTAPVGRTPTLQVDGQELIDFNQTYVDGQGLPSGSSVYGVAGALETGKTAIGISFVRNSLQTVHDASIANATVSADTVAVTAADHSSVLGISAGVGAGTSDGGFAGMGSGTWNTLGNITIASVGSAGAQDGTTTITTSSAGPDALLVKAYNDGSIFALAGSAGVGRSTANTAGLAVAWNSLSGETTASISNAAVTTAGSNASVQALGLHSISAIAASLAMSPGSLSLGGSFTINDISDTLTASVDTGSSIKGGLTVRAGDSSGGRSAQITALAGGFGVSGNGTAVGAGVSVNNISSTYLARVAASTVTLSDKASLSVTADNSARIFAAALGGVIAQEYAAGASTTTNNIGDTVMAEIDGVTVDLAAPEAATSLRVSANNNALIQALAGGVGVSLGNAGLGAAVAVNRIANAVTAAIRSSTIDAGDVLVSAQSRAEIDSLALGVASATQTGSAAGSVAVNLIDTTVDALIDNSGAGAANSHVKARSNVGVLAASLDAIKSLAGAVSLGLGSTYVSGGASTTVNNINGHTRAVIAGASVDALGYGDGLSVNNGQLKDGDVSLDLSGVTGYVAPTATNNTLSGFMAPAVAADTKLVHGVAVNAASQRTLGSISVTGALNVNPDPNAPSLALSATTTVDYTGGDTSALVKNASINQGAGLAGDAAQQVDISASNHSYGRTIVGAGAGALWGGAGAAVGVETIELQTIAQIADSAVAAASGVRVDARSTAGASFIGVGFAAGTGAFVGTGSVVNFDGKTLAAVDGGTITGGGLDVNANSANRALLIAGGASLGPTVGASGSFAIVNSNQDTRARIGKSAAGKVSTADVGGTVNVQAGSNSNNSLYAASGTLSASFGLGLAAGVAVISNTTSASIENGSEVNAGGKVTVAAADTGDLALGGGTLGIGLSGAGAGATAAVSVVRSQVTAAIDNAAVTGKGVEVDARNSQHAAHTVVAVGVGGAAGVSGTVSVIRVGTGDNDSADTDDTDVNSILSRANAFASSDKAGATNGALSDEELASVSSATQHGIGTDLLSGGGSGSGSESVAMRSGKANSAHAYISGNSHVTTTGAGDLNVAATSATSTTNNVGAIGGGGTVGVGVAVGVTQVYNDVGAVIGPNTHSDVAGALNVAAEAKDGATGKAVDTLIVAGAGAGVATVAVNVGVGWISDNVIANVGGVANVDGAVSVKASDSTTLDARNANVSIGGTAGVGVVVLSAGKSGSTWAALNADNRPSAVLNANSVAVDASSSGRIFTAVYAASGGLYGAVGVNRASSSDSMNVTASIGDGTMVGAYGGVTVQASRTPQVVAEGYGVGLSGGLQVGATETEANVSGATRATVGSNAVFGGIGLDADNQLTFGTLDVIARNLVAANSYSASSTSFASGGALVASINGSSATAGNTGSVTAEVLDNVVLPMSDVTISAEGNSSQYASASGVSVGALGAGGNVARATSDTTTTARLGQGAISAILVDSNNQALAVRGGAIKVLAAGTESNTAWAISGSGGLIAGAAADATTTSRGTTTAEIASGASQYAATLRTDGLLTKVALDYGVTQPLMAGEVVVDARHTGRFFSHSNSIQGSIAGSSGASSYGAVNYKVNARIGDNVRLHAADIDIDALNVVIESGTEPNAEGGSGGVLAGSGVSSVNVIETQSNVSVGANSELAVVGDPITSPGRFSAIAATHIAASDQTSSSGGGAVTGMSSDSKTTVTATNTLKIGKGAALDSVGDLDLGTYSLIDVSNNSYAHGYGLAGASSGSAVSTITSNQSILVDDNATVNAWGDLSIATGRGDQAAYQNSLKANAINAVYSDGAITDATPYARAIIDNIGSVVVNAGAKLTSVRDTLLGALAGVVKTNAQGDGHYRIVGIGTTNSDSATSESGSQSVTMNGSAVAGSRHLASLHIDANGNVTADNVSYTDMASYMPVGQLQDQISRLTALLDQSTDEQTRLEIRGSIDALTALSNTLQGRGLAPTTSVQAVEVGDTMAAAGNIEVNAGTFSGSGSLSAYGGPQILLTNDSSKFLIVDKLFIPNATGGNIKFTGSAKPTASYQANNMQQVGRDQAPSIQIVNNFDAAQSSGVVPSIFLTDTLENRGGSLYIANKYGDLGQFGAISVNQQTILLPNGAYIVDTPLAGKFLGGAPENEYVSSDGTIYQLTPGNLLGGGILGTGLPATANEAVTYVVNYLAGEYGCAGLSSAAFSACLAGNPPAGNASGQTGTGYMYFYPSNFVKGDYGSSSDYIRDYGPDINFYNGRYQYPTVGVRSTTNNIQTLSPQNPSNTVTKVGTTAVINAKFINMNGTLKVGLDTDFSASIAPVMINAGVDANGTPVSVDLIACIDDVTCRPYAAQYRASDGTYKYPSNAVIASDDTLIDVYYNPNTKKLVMDNVSGGGGGSVSLQGAIINTNPGGTANISVSDGYAHVTVRNDTDTALVTRDINTGNGNVGVVKITDTLKTDDEGRALTTWYVYKLGEGTQTYTSATAADYAGLTADVSSAGNTATYNPKTGERYWWTYSAELARSFLNENGASGYFENKVGDWSFVPLPQNQPNTYADIWSLTSGLMNDLSLKDTAFQEKITGSSIGDTYQEGYSANGALTWNWYVPTQVSIQATSSVKADYPINIAFTGANTSGLVDIASKGSVVVGGNIRNGNGLTTIAATGAGATITATSDGSIQTQSLVLNADAGIGDIASPLRATLTLPAEGAPNANSVSAVTRTGDIGLSLDGADAYLSRIATDAGSDVMLRSANSMLALDPGSTLPVVSGRNITLASDDGSIGALNAPLRLNAMSTRLQSGAIAGGIINAAAYGDIALTQIDGDMYIGHVKSDDGDVSLEARLGSIRDGRGMAASDRSAELAEEWDKLNLLDKRTGSSADDITQSAGYASTVAPYQDGVNAQYANYWSLLAMGSLSADGEAFTLSSDGARMMQPQADAAGMTVQAFAQNRYQTLRDYLSQALDGTEPGWQNGYDQNFSYTASAGQIDGMTRGQYWTSDALLYSINNAALAPASGSVTVVDDVNVSGKKVILNAANASASVGELADAVHFDLSSGGASSLSAEQKAALAGASSAGDIINQVFERNGEVDASCSTMDAACRLVAFDVKQTAPIFVNVLGGLSASAGTDIYIQAKDSLPIAGLNAGRDIHLTSMTGMSNVAAEGADAITTGNNLVLQNGVGSIGSADRAMSLAIGGLLEAARSGDASGMGDMYLSALRGDLSFYDLYASRVLSLTTSDTAPGMGNVYSRNAIGGAGVASLAAQYLQFNTTGSVYGFDPSQPLLVNVGGPAQAGYVSGIVGGDLYLGNAFQLGVGRNAVDQPGAAAYLPAEGLRVGGNAHLDSSGSGLVFTGAAQVDGDLTVDHTTHVAFDAAGSLKVNGDMSIDAGSIAMQAGSRAGADGSATWRARSGDISVAYLSGANVALTAANGKILGVSGSPFGMGENVYARDALVINGGASGAMSDGSGIGGEPGGRFIVAAGSIDAATRLGDIALGLVAAGDVAASSVSAATPAGTIDILSSVDFTARRLVSNGGAQSGTDGDTGSDIRLTATGAAAMTLNDINAGRDLIATAANGAILVADNGGLRAARDVRLTVSDGDLRAGTGSAINGGRDAILNIGGALTADSILAGGSATLNAGGALAAARLSANGGIIVNAGAAALGQVSTAAFASLAAKRGGLSVDDLKTIGATAIFASGDARIGTLQVGNAAIDSDMTAHAGGELSMGTGDIWGGLDARSGSLDIGAVRIHRGMSAATDGDMRIGALDVGGNLNLQAGGALTLQSGTAGGAGTLSAANMRLGTMQTGGDTTLTASGDIDYLNLRSGGSINARLAGGLSGAGGGVFTGANDINVTAGQISFDTMVSGRNTTLTAGGDVRANTLATEGSLAINSGGFAGLGEVNVGGAMTLESASGMSIQRGTLNVFNIRSRGNVELGDVGIGSSLTVQADSFTGKLRPTAGRRLTLDVTGYDAGEGGHPMASNVDLKIDAPEAVDFTRLWTKNAMIETNAYHNGIADGYISNVMRYDTPAGRILMNGRDITSVPNVAMQLYEPNQSFLLGQDGNQFYTSALVTQFGPHARNSTDSLGGSRGVTVYDTSADREIGSQLPWFATDSLRYLRKVLHGSMPTGVHPAVAGDPDRPEDYRDGRGIVNTVRDVSMADPASEPYAQ
ncbi:leukotoxin LktA family filamentous adhesin [Pollutimonas bauzanensis]|uniref:Filamentous haemagglutinin FhaB/tRNA nuclease CdiA-like TPS domain-containing protein n=1 Tax=Pollutimonas bauzanensis TaxID=658167 RepID=A0A1M5Q1K3_9BURK|nr:leukotoxin LktA family filamentous adhesin [Pollutimonas bauzanensis]SHH07353.1 hypothetical protein SAMN04488135_102114 [Pollutimonas bauzanensis]